jgi:hypothetical protein
MADKPDALPPFGYRLAKAYADFQAGNVPVCPFPIVEGMTIQPRFILTKHELETLLAPFKAGGPGDALKARRDGT